MKISILMLNDGQWGEGLLGSKERTSKVKKRFLIESIKTSIFVLTIVPEVIGGGAPLSRVQKHTCYRKY